MTSLHEVLKAHVDDGSMPGAVGLVAHGDRVEAAVVGSVDTEGTAPMARDTIFRLASVTKPITTAAAMTLIDDGTIALEDLVAPWLPELADPTVVRVPEAAVDDAVPADRGITVEDLLSFRAGYGFPSDFSLPAVQPLFSELKGPLMPQAVPAPDEWMARLAGIPMLRQPGEAWLYNTCSDILGVLIARASGQPLPEFLAERLFEPLGMTDTAFSVPARKLDRFTSSYRAGADGALAVVDAPDGEWSSLPAFPSAAGGLVSTADDLLAFGRMLLAGGTADGRELLSADSVRRMTTDHLTRAQREASGLFLEGQGWGYGGAVDVAAVEPWNEPGRYGWVGGTGTSWHITPSTGTVAVLLTQREMPGPSGPDSMRAFWRYASGPGS
ncbi:serine hydrolase domain-containing protein [Streptomyces katsurahamanus]|uniref:Beta-lactamase family protein n=1 Tax=Streptomyces katsurahamanus TaxID=2577098 RepID=A0ABW9NSJ5_9ACTN|nr:serine hydrolase domain-containing protein [Streptomyces katsurahamanus]MQS36282.1 beta-lactamase family protein [Streptomyces katsurahamanus]